MDIFFSKSHFLSIGSFTLRCGWIPDSDKRRHASRALLPRKSHRHNIQHTRRRHEAETLQLLRHPTRNLPGRRTRQFRQSLPHGNCRYFSFLILPSFGNGVRKYVLKIMKMSGQRIIQSLRKTVYGSIMKQEIAFFDKNKTGELINRLSSDTTVVGFSVTMNISDGMRSLFGIIASVSMMVRLYAFSVSYACFAFVSCALNVQRISVLYFNSPGIRRHVHVSSGRRTDDRLWQIPPQDFKEHPGFVGRIHSGL